MRLSAFGGRFGLKFGCLRDSPARFCGRSPPIMPIDSVCWYGDGRFGVALWCGPSFLGGLFCGLPPGCCGGRFVCLGARGCRCCLGGLLFGLSAAQGNPIPALSPRASSPPPNCSSRFIATSICRGLFCGLPPGCCGGRFVCLGACGCRCCWGGLLLWLCAAEGNAIAALSPRASSPPPNWSRSFIAPYICGLCCCPQM